MTETPDLRGPATELADDMARAFHENYEALAPRYGYRTREASAVPWDEVPKANRELMIHTSALVLQSIRSRIEREAAAAAEARVAVLREALVKRADIVAGEVGFLLSVIASGESLSGAEVAAARENLREYREARAAQVAGEGEGRGR